MQEKNLYEYAIIRIVPRVEREEFINVGVVLYCSSTKKVHIKYKLLKDRVHALCSTTNVEEIEHFLSAFETIAKGENLLSPISKLTAVARFRWLSATRSTVIQTSKVHSGFCNDAAAALQKIFDEMVV